MPDEVYDVMVERHVNDLLLIKRVETLLQQATLRPAEAGTFVSMALGLIEGRETPEAGMVTEETKP